MRKLHLVLFCTVLLATGTLLRLLDLAGVGPLPDMPGIAAVIVPLLGLFELRRLRHTIHAVGRRRQRRLVYRFEGDAEAHCFSDDGHVPARLVDASASGVGLVAEAPLAIGDRPAVLLRAGRRDRRRARGQRPGRGAQLPRGRGPLPGRRHDRRNRPRLPPAADGVVLRRLQPRAPARPPPRRRPLPESEAIVVSLDEYREGPIRPPPPPGDRSSAAARNSYGFPEHLERCPSRLKERDWKSRGGIRTLLAG